MPTLVGGITAEDDISPGCASTGKIMTVSRAGCMNRYDNPGGEELEAFSVNPMLSWRSDRYFRSLHSPGWATANRGVVRSI